MQGRDCCIIRSGKLAELRLNYNIAISSVDRLHYHVSITISVAVAYICVLYNIILYIIHTSVCLNKIALIRIRRLRVM